MKCEYCGKEGHEQKECPRFKANERDWYEEEIQEYDNYYERLIELRRMENEY